MKLLAKYAAAVCVLTVFVVGQSATEYTVAQRLSLTEKTDGVEGELQLLVDTRIRDHVQKDMWDIGSSDFSFDENSSKYRVLNSVPPANAKLQIVDKHGTRIWDKTLALPLAKVAACNIGAHRVVFLTVDESAVFGSYSGLTTTLFLVSSDGLRTIEAFDAASQKRAPIIVAKTLKSDWKMNNTADGIDVLAFYCAPNMEAYKYSTHPLPKQAFDVHYVRYRFNGQEWFRHERVERGFWENDQPFPLESSFPK